MPKRLLAPPPWPGQPAGFRFKKGNYGFPIEQKSYDMSVKATGQAQKKQTDHSEQYPQLQPETHAQIRGKPAN